MLNVVIIGGKSPQHNPMKEVEQMHKVNEKVNTKIPVFCNYYYKCVHACSV